MRCSEIFYQTKKKDDKSGLLYKPARRWSSKSEWSTNMCQRGSRLKCLRTYRTRMLTVYSSRKWKHCYKIRMGRKVNFTISYRWSKYKPESSQLPKADWLKHKRKRMHYYTEIFVMLYTMESERGWLKQWQRTLGTNQELRK